VYGHGIAAVLLHATGDIAEIAQGLARYAKPGRVTVNGEGLAGFHARTNPRVAIHRDYGRRT
jgi:hypothetical protein